jgi:pyochelin synthetase
MIRVLEVGAGTGSCTSEVLKLVSYKIHEYIFTDLVISFLRQAKDRFSTYQFLKFMKFDINCSLIDQGVKDNCMDYVIGMNADISLGISMTH